MASGLAARYAEALVAHSRLVVVVLLVATAVVGAGAGGIESGLTIASFGSDSTEAQKLSYVEENFTTGQENTTTVQVVVRGENVLSKESLLATLRFQRAVRENETVAPTLVDGRPTTGLANQIALAAIRQETPRAGGGAGSGGPNGTSGGGAAGGGAGGDGAAGPPRQVPTLDEQITQLASMSPPEVREVTAAVLAPDGAADGSDGSPRGGPGSDPYALLSTGYEPGSTTAEARVLFVFQQTSGDGDSLPADVVDAQLTMQEIADREIGGEGTADAFVFGAGIVDEESGRATGESFALISPVALLFVVVVLTVAYRDLFDVVLALLGVVLVLVWMGGFMGWAGFGVTQIVIAVPFLLIGLSIDYALHVVMRYREARTGSAGSDGESPARGSSTEDETGVSVRDAMRAGLGGVVVALAATTFTTAVGFLSNTVSPITSIAEFGAISAAGIVAAFVVFAGLLPAVKVELDGLLERFGFDRERRAFGTDGAASRLVGVGTTVARRAPVVIVVLALLVSAGGGYAATEIDTSIDQTDFLPRDSPAWMDALPAPFQPSEYTLRENVIYLNDNFLQSRDRSQVEILVEGDVTSPGTLDRLAAGREAVAETDSAVTLANGNPSVQGPLSVIRQTAANNATVAAVVERADTDDDGVPDQNLTAVYDAVFGANPERAVAVFYRTDSSGDTSGEYRALRVTVAVRGGADTGTVTEEMRTVADEIEGTAATGLIVTATGQPIVSEIVQQGLLQTLVETFLITLGVILAFLTVIFYRRYGTLSLGAVTMVPVVFALSWILGTMYLLSIPFNSETAIIASIAIGIGVDYAIHISERFVEEREQAVNPFAALEATVSGTGGALLASAVTTAGGFGLLVLALVPSLRRFGLVTSTAIVYAFLASVVVLPSLLVLWDRYLNEQQLEPTAEESEVAAGD